MKVLHGVCCMGMVLAVAGMALRRAGGGGAEQRPGASSRPASRPGSQGASMNAKITPEAKEILDKMQKAYSTVRTLRISGTETSQTIATSGKQQFVQRTSAPFTAYTRHRTCTSWK